MILILILLLIVPTSNYCRDAIIYRHAGILKVNQCQHESNSECHVNPDGATAQSNALPVRVNMSSLKYWVRKSSVPMIGIAKCHK